MSAAEVYQEIETELDLTCGTQVDPSSIRRLSLYVTGAIEAQNGSPAQVARAIARLKLSQAKAESLERQIRRMENDPEVQAETCLHPLARLHLVLGKPRSLLLIVDPTLQEDRVVLVSVNVWFRGRSLPLAWTLYPANCPLQGASFWQRIQELLQRVAELLPRGVPVSVVADRAFGTPAFTDLVAAQHWHWLVRVQDQTLYRDCKDRQGQIGQLVRVRNQRKKLRGWAFKKAGWREASVVVYWGRRHKKPLCLVSDLPPHWHLLAYYRRRFPIEGTFRDLKAYGWGWEQHQVINLAHIERLLVGMALATWFALRVGCWRAEQLLSRPPTGRRHTRPYEAKLSLFHLGLDCLARWLAADAAPPFNWVLSGWDAPNWSSQLTAHHARAFVFAL